MKPKSVKEAYLRERIRALQNFAEMALVVIVALLVIILWLAMQLHARAAAQPETSAVETTEETAQTAAPVMAADTMEYGETAEPEALEYIYLSDCPMCYGDQEIMQDACREYNVPYSLALGVAEAESSFDKDADSGVAYGLMQIHPINYERLQENGINPETYEGNIEAGVFLLGELLEAYPTTHKALMCYNCGETSAAEQWDMGYTTSPYSRQVVTYAAKWQTMIDAEAAKA